MFKKDFVLSWLKCFILILVVAGSAISAETLILQQGYDGYTGTEDTWINSALVYTNYGAGSSLFIRTDLENTLLKFDVSGLPDGAVISSATLKLYQHSDYGTPSECNVALWRMKRSWAEGVGPDAGGDFNVVNGASWWYYDNWWSMGWASRPDGADGALGAGDRGSSPKATGSWLGEGAYGTLTNPGWRTFDVTDDVQAWAVGVENWGWLLTLDSGSRPLFYSSEYAINSGLRPILEINYTIDTNYVADLGFAVLQDGLEGYSGTVDTWLNPSSVYSNYGASSKLFVRTGTTESTLLKFDVSALEGVIVTSATLELYQFADYGTPSECIVDFWRMQRSWAEGTATADAGGSFYDYIGASWWYYEGSWSASWGSRTDGADGALGAGDRGSSPTATGSWVGTGTYGNLTNPGWRTFDVTDDVQSWVSGSSNWGWQITLASGSRPVFYSSDSSVPTLRPVLRVQYEINPNVLVLQEGRRGYSGTADTWLNSGAVWSNYGAGKDLYIRSGPLENTLIKFDIPDISNAVVSSATLKLYNYDDGNPGWECTMDAYRMQRAWAEGTAGTAGGSFYDYVGSSWWYYEGSWSASWSSRTNGADGALGVGDRGAAPTTASVNWTNYGSVWSITNPGWRELDVTSDVQAWASGASNWGWQITLASGSRPVFYSSDSTVDPTLRPILIVNYTPGSGSSENVDVTEDFEDYITDANLWFNEPEASSWNQIGADYANISTISVAGNNTKKLRQQNYDYDLWYAMDLPVGYNVADPVNQADPLIVTAEVAITGTRHGSWPFANHIMVGKVAIGISGDDIAYGIVNPGDSTRISTVSLLTAVDQIEVDKWYEVKIVYHQVAGSNNDTADLYFRAKGSPGWNEIITNLATDTDLASDLHVYTIGDFGDLSVNIGYIDNIDVRYPAEKPTFCGDDNTYYLKADINKDCRVDLKDVEQMSNEWLY